MVCDRVYGLKTIIATFLMLVTLKHEYLNELQGAVSNKYEYIITTVNT